MGAVRQMRVLGYGLLAVLVIVAAGAFGYFLSIRPGEAETRGRALYLANCAACHGVNLEGQADWMKRLPSGRLPAPPHDEAGHTWHHPDKQLFTLVKAGLAAIAPGYESDMPAFDGVLTDQQIIDILDYIKGTWPERARQYQADRTAADPT